RTFKNNCRDTKFIQKAHNDPLAPTILPTQWVASMNRWIKKIESSTVRITVPALIIQGTNDSTVDGVHNIKILQQLYHTPDILWLEGARHHLPNELENTRTIYLQCIERKLSMDFKLLRSSK
ncbi:MAG: alpha/beta hydrolase, partial [Endozoicomonas sp.]